MSSNLFDICFNFTSDTFRKDEQQVVERAFEANVTQFLVTGSDANDSETAVELCNRFGKGFYASCGVHPHLAKNWNTDTEQRLKALARENAVVAIGETGLDYHRNFSPREQQLSAFELQCELATTTCKPLFLHERDAHEDFFSVVKSFRDRIDRMVVHCFTGDRKSLYRYLDLDLYIGITGWICDERRGTELKTLVADIPDQRLMIETDAPYLLPRSLPELPKNRRNEPCFLPHIADTIALHRKQPVGTVIQQTTRNAMQFFDIDTAQNIAVDDTNWQI